MKSTAMPSRFYGDPANCCDERRKLTELAKKLAECDRKHKSRRIQMLVKQAKRGR